MTNIESPGSYSLRSFGDTENAESSEAELQFPEPCAPCAPLEEPREDPPEEPSSKQTGVHLRQRNKKFAARLCLPGSKGQKLDLGEYNTHDEAARAYQVGAFYYNKSSTSNCGEVKSVLDALPCVPDNLSGAAKAAWVRERARHSAATISTSERPRTSASKSVLGSRRSSFDARPGTPASYGTQGSCGNYHSAPSTPTTPETPYSSFFADDASELHDLDLDSWLPNFPNSDEVMAGQLPVLDFCDTTVDRHTRKSAAPHISSEITGSKRRKCVETRSRGLPNVEPEQGRNYTTHLNNQTPVADHQAVSQVKFTDSIIFALCELRKQGWEWTLKSRSPSSVEAGVLFSVPQGQHAAPALRITDIITNSFHELREQGWEVHLQPHGCGNVEVNLPLFLFRT